MAYSEILVMRVFDGVACALLAAAAVCLARKSGGHVSGSLVLGCLCALLGPLLRETFLHGQQGSAYILGQLPPEALTGALAGLAAMYILPQMHSRLFFWLDTAGIGLASCTGALLALPDTGITGALCLGLVNGLAPGLVRDVALGNIAMLVEKSWYATASALAVIVSIGVLIYLSVGWVNEWTAMHAEETAVLAGWSIILIIRGVKLKNDPEYLL